MADNADPLHHIHYGPTLPISIDTHYEKYRSKNESFEDRMSGIAGALSAGDPKLFSSFRNLLLSQTFLPGGRIQSAAGSPRNVTMLNCFVSMQIEDNSDSIFQAVQEAWETMRKGGGIGYDFSRIRPRGDNIVSLDTRASGPVSFMEIFDATCNCSASAGHRRGAQMGVLRVDHPDIEEFVDAKTNKWALTRFNISVGITDKFMQAVKDDAMFDLTFNGKVYRQVRATYLWDKILRNTWHWAEPGVLFIDRMNQKNNLFYCETIEATNPCGEQPLPPYGACLLGSFNLVKYLIRYSDGYGFDFERFENDIPVVIEAMDNVIDASIYPLPEQEAEAKNKRRMGIGITGLANTLETLGYPYGSPGFIRAQESILKTLRDEAYLASTNLAARKGCFPLYNPLLLESGFAKTLPDFVRTEIQRHGLRNSHLLSIAPTGTISLCADNVSSGIEPVFSKEYNRTIQSFDGPRVERVTDYAYRVYGTEPKTADQVPVQDHVKVLNSASKFVDSACSKTCNVGDDVTWEEFKQVYMDAYEGGASGCTTFRAAGSRMGVLTKDDTITDVPATEHKALDPTEGGACYYDPSTGVRTCDE